MTLLPARRRVRVQRDAKRTAHLLDVLAARWLACPDRPARFVGNDNRRQQAVAVGILEGRASSEVPATAASLAPTWSCSPTQMTGVSRLRSAAATLAETTSSVSPRARRSACPTSAKRAPASAAPDRRRDRSRRPSPARTGPGRRPLWGCRRRCPPPAPVPAAPAARTARWPPTRAPRGPRRSRDLLAPLQGLA